ncbi:MAG: hypothetical protein A3I72_04480 [Candidatus Tectomicrobia bacterium RIFCSPLOWO2_02_FULL_70_19]|nr:MAG: hypothetical protein A3I72_04480 [Candidatus Tectomicrobia bacterium RIFCSPLOWO2_02_FULL_70_19]
MIAWAVAGILVPSLALLAGCGAMQEVKHHQVEIRVPAPAARPVPARARLVLLAADARQEPGLSRTEEYALREKAPLPTTLLAAAAPRMRAAGIEPLEDRESRMASGQIAVVLTRLEAKLEKTRWLASAALTVEAADNLGRPMGRWEAIGRGAHDDTRIMAGAAGLALGKAIGEALDRIPWAQVGRARPSP